MKKFTTFLGIIIVLAIMAFIAWLLYEFYIFFITSEDQIKAAFIGIFGVTLAASISHFFSQRREIASRQFAAKVTAYEGVFDLIFEILNGIRINDELTEETLVERAVKIKRDLMIWAGPEVLKAWSDFEKDAATGDNANVMKCMEKIFRCLRKELGHNDRSLSSGSFIKWIVQVDDHEKIEKQLNM